MRISQLSHPFLFCHLGIRAFVQFRFATVVLWDRYKLIYVRKSLSFLAGWVPRLSREVE